MKFDIYKGADLFGTAEVQKFNKVDMNMPPDISPRLFVKLEDAVLDSVNHPEMIGQFVEDRFQTYEIRRALD